MKARRSTALAVMVISIVNVVVFVFSAVGTEEFSQHALFGPMLLAYPAVALVVLWRRSHPVAWLLLTLGLLLGPFQLFSTFVLERPVPLGTGAGWGMAAVAAAIPFPLFAMLLPALGLRFPDGKLPSERWRWVERLYAIGVAAVVCGMLLAPFVKGGPAGGPSWLIGNPLSEPWTEPIRKTLEFVALGTLLPGIVSAIVAVIVRFRRSEGIERQQMRWLTYSLLGVLLTWPLAAGAAFLVAGERGPAVVAGLYSMLVLVVPALGIGMAVTRHRLYDLDRIISRTLSYALVVALLAGAYAGSVLGLSTVARAISGGSSDLVVAMSTLVVAALFQPVTRRVQRLVERRFNRARYDAARTVETFGRGLRDELETQALVVSLRDATVATLQPSRVSVQLVGRPRS